MALPVAIWFPWRLGGATKQKSLGNRSNSSSASDKHTPNHQRNPCGLAHELPPSLVRLTRFARAGNMAQTDKE